ncbi:flagellar hook-associated protein FlgL [Amantichitinum ursilacus]|uniref:Flagellar hook-associated protein 3 n=1 Tax=Amantichitinum ursilacus TaxID=857265 RepID=A0A0N0GQP0_9NEIS|nr:flagellar hook-associated protein FlgL [Amantichitinum ursilacus]KPC54810.1 Flagellar hook-associated protein 3 [Amantichitinum ursilacus]
MRVASSTLYNLGTSSLNDLYYQQTQLQQQLSTGRKMLSPSDDPIAASRALYITQSASIVTQFTTNSNSANTSLQNQTSALASVASTIQDIQSLAVQAGNPTLTSAEKQIINTSLNSSYQQLMGLANTTDGSGLYLFSGFAGGTKPFTETGFGNVTYNGDQGQRQIQISASRNLPVSSDGSSVFQNIKDGNGTFSTAAAATNSGTGLVSAGEVLDKAKWNTAANVKNFSVKFNSITNTADPSGKPIVNYDIVDNRQTLTDGTTNPNYNHSMIDGYDYTAGDRTAAAGVNPYPRSYTDGGDIVFSAQSTDPAPAAGATLPVPGWDFGVKMSITGTPADGDTFNVDASQNQDIFSTIAQFSSALNSYTTSTSGADQTKFQNALNGVMSNLNNALQNVLSANASTGAWQNEITAVQTINSSVSLNYSQTLSGLQDLDYASAISGFSQNQTLLEAARQTYSKIQGNSLFQYIS